MDENPLLNRNLRALTAMGMWPTHALKHRRIYNMYSNALYIWFCYFTASQFVEIYFVRDDIKEMSKNFGVSILSAVGVAKVYTVLFKQKTFRYLVDIIRETEQEILKQNNPEKKKILDEYIEQNWQVTRNFWILTCGTILGFFICPPLQEVLEGKQEILFKNGTSTGRFKKPMVFSSWFPFDKYSDKYYILAYGIQTFAGIVGAAYLGIWDTFIVGLIIFGIGQFRILQYSLRTVYELQTVEEDVTESTMSLTVFEEKKINDNFIKCVKHHNKIIKYAKDLNALINPVMFLDLCVCSFMLCAIGLQVVLEGLTIKLAFTVEYLVAMLIQLFMFYWHANELMLESVKVSEATFQCQWYNCTASVKKGIIMLMMRAQRPITLSAGRFYTMSVETFIMILRSSYSVMALMLQVYDGPAEDS